MNQNPFCFYYRVQLQKFFRKDFHKHFKYYCYYPSLVFAEFIRPIMPVYHPEHHQSHSKEIIKIIISFFVLFVFFTVVISFYQEYENWTLTDTVYFVIATISSVGK
jgi:hypothetical protein